MRTKIVPGDTRFSLPLLLAACLGGLACEDSTGLPAESHPLIQTDSPEYRLEPYGAGWHASIPYTFTNRTGRPVYLANCRGGFGVHLDREDNGTWRTVWSPVLLLCLSPPIVIGRYERFTHTLSVWGARPGTDIRPQFDREDPSGTYRIVWDAAYHLSGPGFPAAARISNEFVLRK